MTEDDLKTWFVVAVALIGALLLSNFPVCEEDASLCAIRSEEHS